MGISLSPVSMRARTRERLRGAPDRKRGVIEERMPRMLERICANADGYDESIESRICAEKPSAGC